MIPLRDLLPTRITPFVTWAIIAANVVVYLASSAQLDATVERFGAVAYMITGAEPTTEYLRGLDGIEIAIRPVPYDSAWPVRVFAHMWLHVGVLHVLGNVWFLFVFGDNVEERLGRFRFAVFYIASGLVALGAQVVADPSSGIPMVGASGAVSGVLGAYLRFFPHARVLALVPLGFLFLTVVWPAVVFLGLWIVLQLASVLAAGDEIGGVAWWAHIAGFAVGWLAAPLFAPRRARISVRST